MGSQYIDKEGSVDSRSKSSIYLIRLITRYRYYISLIQPLNSKISLSRPTPQFFIKIQKR
jgi:hypothetical protein